MKWILIAAIALYVACSEQPLKTDVYKKSFERVELTRRGDETVRIVRILTNGDTLFFGEYRKGKPHGDFCILRDWEHKPGWTEQCEFRKGFIRTMRVTALTGEILAEYRIGPKDRRHPEESQQVLHDTCREFYGEDTVTAVFDRGVPIEGEWFGLFPHYVPGRSEVTALEVMWSTMEGSLHSILTEPVVDSTKDNRLLMELLYRRPRLMEDSLFRYRKGKREFLELREVQRL